MTAEHTKILYKDYHEKYHLGNSKLDDTKFTIAYVLDSPEQDGKYLENYRINSADSGTPHDISKEEWSNFVHSKRHAELIQIREGRDLAIQEYTLQKALQKDPSIRTGGLTQTPSTKSKNHNTL